MKSDRPSTIGLPTICSMIATAAVAVLTSANWRFRARDGKRIARGSSALAGAGLRQPDQRNKG